MVVHRSSPPRVQCPRAPVACRLVNLRGRFPAIVARPSVKESHAQQLRELVEREDAGPREPCPRAPAAAAPGSIRAARSSPPPPWIACSPGGASPSSAKPEAMGGPLLRPGQQDGSDHADLTIGGALGGPGRSASHALRSHSKGSGGSARRIVIGRSLVSGLSHSPRLVPPPVASSTALPRDPSRGARRAKGRGRHPSALIVDRTRWYTNGRTAP